MTDEKFVFLSDAREKKSIGRSARNRRTHAGKRGSVHFPSDFLSNKELRAMNGEVKAYRLNEPMTWAEFKNFPDDLKATYIKNLRAKFGVPDIRIAEMLGVSSVTLGKYLKMLRLSQGKAVANKYKSWDDTEWRAWAYGEAEKTEPETETDEPTVPDEENISPDPVEIHPPEDLWQKVLNEGSKETPVPVRGEMVFTGSAADALAVVSRILGNANCTICVSWHKAEEVGV